jgi:hypothetical protein
VSETPYADAFLNLDRFIAFYPQLTEHLGSTTANVMLCSFRHWSKLKGGGEFWKTAEQIEEETGLTYREQASARKVLVDKGLLEERHARLEHRMYFRLNPLAINDLLRIALSAVREKHIPQFGDDAFRSSGTADPAVRYTEETPVETPEETPERAQAPRPAKEYEFEGQVVRLTKRDFDAWQKAFSYLELRAELISRDNWLGEQPANVRKTWFQSTSTYLRNRNAEAKANKESPNLFRRMAGGRGGDMAI